jgi:hypothetical protein
LSCSQAGAAQELEVRLVIAPSHLIPFGFDEFRVLRDVHRLHKLLWLAQRLKPRVLESRLRAGTESRDEKSVQRVEACEPCPPKSLRTRLCIEKSAPSDLRAADYNVLRDIFNRSIIR